MALLPHSIANPFSDLSLERLRRRTSAKWRVYPEDVLPLWVAEMDAMIASPIVAAVQTALSNGDTGYPAGFAYAESMASFALDRWRWAFDPSTTAMVTDVMTGIVEVIRIISPDDEAIVVTPPVYPPFYGVARTLGRTIVLAPLDPQYRLDSAALEAAFIKATMRRRGAILLLANPHNPAGTVPTREELDEVARLARQYGVRVIADEIHAPLMMPTSTFTPYLMASGTGPDFSVSSASKGWNLAAFKAAVIVPGTDSVRDLQSFPEREGNHPGHIGLIAHTAAYNDARSWLDAAVAGIDANRHTLAALLGELLPNARYCPPESTYLAWIDCGELGLGDEPAKVFLEHGRVALSSGTAFGEGGAGYVRLNLATSTQILTEAVTRMASVHARTVLV
ncbi:MAG: Cystathionine beta-lyase, type II [uncultured Thermomicrobiales bacterium]|uniref:cysteine-S-conjugate beta-lyase n=1 Tax=uncultured Thermomicrobiales bacterium TaxID=1645740 RepID=A0A6J4U3W5_9BACT|nr:MAG: Cystathionine beta-lyase, type II [uncultured Thermomicrobiales bacterium]